MLVAYQIPELSLRQGKMVVNDLDIQLVLILLVFVDTKSGPDASVVRHLVDIPITEDGVDNLDVPCEHLIEMSPLAVGLGPLRKCSSEIVLRQLLDDG